MNSKESMATLPPSMQNHNKGSYLKGCGKQSYWWIRENASIMIRLLLCRKQKSTKGRKNNICCLESRAREQWSCKCSGCAAAHSLCKEWNPSMQAGLQVSSDGQWRTPVWTRSTRLLGCWQYKGMARHSLSNSESLSPILWVTEFIFPCVQQHWQPAMWDWGRAALCKGCQAILMPLGTTGPLMAVKQKVLSLR